MSDVLLFIITALLIIFFGVIPAYAMYRWANSPEDEPFSDVDRIVINIEHVKEDDRDDAGQPLESGNRTAEQNDG